MVYNKAEFKKHIETLQVEGFKLKNAVQAYLFVRKYSNRTETITLSYRNYAPHGFYIDGVSADIYFPEVEGVLEQYGLVEEYKSTLGKSFQNIQGINYQLLSIEINSYETFNLIKPVVEEIVEKGAMPFFHRFSSLQNLADFLADKKVEEIRPYIQGGILLLKTALILKMTNHNKFMERLNEFRNILNEYSSKNNSYYILFEKFDTLFASDIESNK